VLNINGNFKDKEIKLDFQKLLAVYSSDSHAGKLFGSTCQSCTH
jgi:hypothetical protein